MPSYYSYQNSGNPYWTPGVRFLILTNLAVFGFQILFLLLPASWGLANFLRNYFALSPNKVIENFYVWQLITNAFLHDEDTIFHLLFNILTLYFLGHMVERHYGTRKFLVFYFSCAVFASLTFTIVHFIKHTTPYCLGASGAILGVLTLAACIYPHTIVYFNFLFPLRLRTIVWILIGINIYIALPFHHSQGVAVSAHLGGILFGYLYYRFNGKLARYFERIERHIIKEYQKEHSRKQKGLREEVDRLLDKISREGLGSLTPKEREFLQNASKEYQKDIKP